MWEDRALGPSRSYGFKADGSVLDLRSQHAARDPVPGPHRSQRTGWSSVPGPSRSYARRPRCSVQTGTVCGLGIKIPPP